MRAFVSLLTNLLLYNKFLYSTIDISEQEYRYLAGHLTDDECRKLVASLYFVTNDLPDVLADAVNEIPSNITCYDLLLNWNSGKEKWQGYGKTHEIVERRLRQIGKIDLSKWLGITVFHNLAKDLNDTINTAFEDKACDRINSIRKLVDNHKYSGEHDHWETFDLILCVALISVSGAVLFNCCRILCAACEKWTERSTAQQDELQYLLKDHPILKKGHVTK